MGESRSQAYGQRELTSDIEHTYVGYRDDGVPSRCRIRIYEAPGLIPVVLATELPTNPGTLMTPMVDYLVAEILKSHLPERFEEEVAVLWIEHYPKDRAGGRLHSQRTMAEENFLARTAEFSLISFAAFTPRIGYLNGRRIRVSGGDELERNPLSRDEVEALIGPLPTSFE